MTRNQRKLMQAVVMIGITMVTQRLLSQEIPAAQEPAGAAVTDNIMWVMWKQFVSNPASVMHMVIMCILAWLIDETTWLNSKYIPHVTVLLGGSTFWLYAGTATVAKCYPFPQVVLFSNGMISGLLAYGGHKQLIARMLRFARSRGDSEDQKKVQT